MLPSSRRWVNAAFLAFLAGCAADSWEKDGIAATQRDRDLAECRATARAAVDRDVAIDNDITASRSQDWMRTGVLERKRETMRVQSRGRAEDVFGRCMAARGYTRVS